MKSFFDSDFSHEKVAHIGHQNRCCREPSLAVAALDHRDGGESKESSAKSDAS